MKSRKYFKKAVAGVSVLAMSAATLLPAAPAMAAGITPEQEAELRAMLEAEAELTAETEPTAEGETGNETGLGAQAAGADITALTKEEIAANDYVLYTANCGTPDPTVVPNQDQERMGLLQSNVDQAYGEDAGTGTTWGCDAPTAYSEAVKSGDDATDIGNSFVYMSDQVEFDKYKSTLGYSFQVPEQAIEGIEEDTYEVTVAFKHYWDGRNVNISLEDKTVAADVSLGYGEWVSRTFTTKVTDGELNVDVSAPRLKSLVCEKEF